MYNIFWNNILVGSAEVKRKGLYLVFTCSCIPKEEGIHRIIVDDGINKVDLGICVPKDGKFTLKTYVPAKYLTGDLFSFLLVRNNENKIKIQVVDKMPFDHLDKLESARLEKSQGHTEIVIEEFQGQPGNDPIQECLSR